MTVQFKPKTVILSDFTAEESLFKAMIKQANQPKESWWVTRSYVTHSEKEPVTWQPYDHSTYTNMESAQLGFDEWVEYLSKNTTINGYRIITLCLDMPNGKAVFQSNFCKEHFKPVEKVYINGPKKKPFPAKAAKYY